MAKREAFRGDAAFAKPEIYEAWRIGAWLEVCHPPSGEREPAAAKLPSCGAAGGKTHSEAFGALQRAFSTGQRAGARPEGSWPRWSITLPELFPRDNFIVTNLTLPSRSVVRLLQQARDGEQWIKEASRRRIGPGCRAIASRRTKMRLQLSVLIATTWATCGGGWDCHQGSRAGR